MNRRALLSLWQATHEPLHERHQSSFLERREVVELTTLPDETVHMAVRAHPKLNLALAHARWLRAGRSGTAPCGCTPPEEDDPDTGVHKLFVGAGPDTREGRSGPRSSTVSGRCSCGWQRQAASEALVRSLWHWHVMGDEEDPVDY